MRYDLLFGDNLLLDWLPYHGLRTLLRFIFGKRKRDEIWNKLPFKRIKSLTFLPDYNKLFYSWEHRTELNSIIHEIYNLQVYERSFTPQRGFTVVDVGAHIGVYTLRAAKKVGSGGLIIAIEPENKNYSLLVKNININKYTNVVPIKLALSSFEGRSELHLRKSGRHSLTRKTSKKIGVSVTTLDKLLKKLGVNEVNLMKMDVEAAELEVLKGSQEILTSKNIFKIVAAAYHTPNQADEIKEFLKAFGYKVSVIKIRKDKFLYASYR